MERGSEALCWALVLITTAGCPGAAGDGTTEPGDGTTEPGDGTTGESTSIGATESTSAGATESTSGGATESTTGEPPDDGVVEACGLPEPCSQYLFECNPINGVDECAGTPYPDGLVCMLETLAAGEQAQLYVNFNGLVTGEVEWIDIAVYGPDAALYQHGLEDPLDFSVYWDPAQQCTPRPAEWFEACLADMGDDAQHIACMNPYEWFEGCSEAMACL